MHVHLMLPAADWEAGAAPAAHLAEVSRDLGLEIICEVMAGGDGVLREAARAGMLGGVVGAEVVGFRQAVLADAMVAPDLFREMYTLASDVVDSERRVWSIGIGKSPEGVLHRCLEVQRLFMQGLRRLRSAVAAGERLRSSGMLDFAAGIARDCAEPQLARIEAVLGELEFPRGVAMSADLDSAHRGTGYRPFWPPEHSETWMRRLQRYWGGGPPETLAYEVPDRDESGLQALSDLRARGVAPLAVILAEATAHLLAFFRQLRLETAFYCGCLNLHAELSARGLPSCFPTPEAAGALRVKGLYDLALGLGPTSPIVGNDLDAGRRPLILITGANRGGKTSFLRGLGQAQLMMHCGMFVPAASFISDLRGGVFTHFRRMEDRGMVSGKLDEELERMRRLVGAMRPDSLLLCNESFASTNEREGAEIAYQVLAALWESGVRIGFVTHLHEFVRKVRENSREAATFLQPELEADGKPTYRLVEGAPEQGGYAEWLYRRLWGSTG